LPPDGYEFGSSLPASEDGGARWKHIRSVLAARSTTGVTLLQNGADHHARQPGLAKATELLQSAAATTGDRLVPSTLRAFAEAFVARATSNRLPLVNGELRDSYGYTWTLQGTPG